MFEGLVDRFQQVKRKILGYGRITKNELETILRDIRVTLLEADVNYNVVKDFIDDLNQKCEKLELAKSLKPGDLVIRAVYEELVLVLGEKPQPLIFKDKPFTTISLIGLQGVGKTTTAAKLALRYKARRPILVPADAKRPAAVAQLVALGQRIGMPVFPLAKNNPIATVRAVKEFARQEAHGLIIIDTAGRLHIDDDLVEELVKINEAIDPDYRLLVADGMSGQDAVNQARNFKAKVGLDGAILTKMDGDTRGGAALSITKAGQVPIFFICTSENLDGLEEFYPDRMAQRILGMGDIQGLVEKVKDLEQKFDQEKIRAKVIKGDLNFEDFLEQFKAIKKLGPLSKLAAMMPGVKESDLDEDELKKVEAIINSMTKKERRNPDVIDGSRKRRIAAGSGTDVADINRLLKQFYYARDLLKKMGKGKMPGNLPFKL